MQKTSAMVFAEVFCISTFNSIFGEGLVGIAEEPTLTVFA